MSRKEEVEKLRPFCIEHGQKGTKRGYGSGRIKDKSGKWKTISLHKLTLLRVSEPSLDSLHVLHKCDNPRCINSDHLYWGSQEQNMVDKVAVGNQYNHELRMLSENDIQYIRENCKPSRQGRPLKGEDTSNTYRGLAKRFNISSATIREVFLRETYNDV